MDTIDIGALVNDAARRYGVDPKLANAVVEMESKGNPNAYSGKAMGVMQLTPATAREMGVKDIWDPVDNINGGMRYLAQLNSRYNGDPRLVLAAYNAGPGAVHQYGGVPPYPETQNYVRTGMGMLGSRLLDRPAPPTPGSSPGEPAGKDPWAVVKSEPYSAPAPEAAPTSESGKDPWAVVQSEPFTAPAEPSPLAKAGQAFYQGIGGSKLADIAKGVWGEVTGDQPAIEKGKQALGTYVQGAVQGLAAEPGRVWNQLSQTGAAMLQGNLPQAGYHFASATPLIGPGLQQVMNAAAQNDPATATGAAGAVVAPFLAGPALGAAGDVAEAAGQGLKSTATFAGGAIPAALKATVQRPPYGAALLGQVLGGPKGAALAATLAKVPAVISAGITGGRAALQSVAEAAAERIAQESAASQVASQAARAAADAEMARHVGTFETFERMTQPQPLALPPAGSVQMPPAGTYAEEQRIAALQPEVSEPPAAPEPPPAPETPPPPEIPKTPGQVYAESQGIDWSKAKPNDRLVYEHIARAQENVRTQQPPPQALQTPQQIAQALKAEMEQSGTVAPPEPPPSFAETARAKKVDALFDVMTRNKIPLSMVEQFGPKEWDMLAKYAGVNPPSETSIGQLKQRLADYEKARNIPVTGATTPAEVQTAFEQARATRARRPGPPPIR